jgi:hypothetical protein
MNATCSVHRSFAAFANDIAHEPVLVVLGVQGSGTNLLCRVLERAFHYSLIEDGSVIFNTASALGGAPTCEQVERSFALIRSRIAPSLLVRKTRRLIKSNTDFTALADHFDPSTIRTGADLARFVYAYGAYRLGTRRMAIKSDDIWEDIEHIDRIVPIRRVLLLTRDFRDNVLSVSKKDFGPIEPLNAAWYVKKQFACYQAEYRRTPPAQRFLVRYEDLLESPLSTAQALSRHFGMPLLAGGARAVETLHIRKSNTRKWMAIAPRTLAHVEAVLREELTTYGYPPAAAEGAPPGVAVWARATVCDTVRRTGQKARRLIKRLRK